MSTTESQQLAKVAQVVQLAEPDFNKLAEIHNAVNFKREASFALQALKANSYLARVAAANQDSLKTAILNVAAVGLSLSPVHKLAYLVPRKDQVCLDISYRGLVHLAIEVGAIQWAIAELVCANDKFQLRGLGAEPIHEFEPFGDRGEIKGAYCVAKTHSGDFLTISMSIKEIYDNRNRSEAWRAYKRDSKKINPWVTDEPEMIKKTVIRRAYKSWPMTDSRQRLDHVIDITSEPEVNDSPKDVTPEPVEDHGFSVIRDLLARLDRTEKQFLDHLSRVNKRGISSLDELTEIERAQATIMLEGFVSKMKPKGQTA